MDAIQLYSATLEQLNKTITTMTSPRWDALVQAATPGERQQALSQMLSVQHARLVLGNATLQDIAEQLKANEQGLVNGQAAVQAALNTLTTVGSVLNAVSSLISVVAKIIPLL